MTFTIDRSIRLACQVSALGLWCLLSAGCGRSANFPGDAKDLEKAFSLTAASPQSGDASTYRTADTPTLAKTLAVALRSGDLDTAALVLHTLNTRGPGLSFDQYEAIRRVLADVGSELSEKAAKGDDHAKDLLKKMGP